MGTSIKHDSMEVIKCLMCQGDVAKAELVDHIAGKHFNYELHKCNQCDFANFDAGNAARHQRETRHQVTLNEFSYNYNEYAEEMIGKAFEDSVAASAGKKRQATSVQVSTRERVASSTRDIIPPVATVDSKIALSDEGMPPPPIMTIPRAQKFTEIPSHHVAGAESMPPPPIKTIPPGQKFTEIPSHHVAGAGSMLPLPASTKQRVQGSSGVLHRHVSSARGKLPPAVVRIQRAQPSVKVPHPHDSSASTFAQQNPRRDQCQLCFVVVPEAVEKRNHVFNKHLDAIVLCPVSGCDFKVSSNCMSALGKIGNHVKDKHGGFKTLTSDEKTAYDENKRKRRGVAEGVYRDCFCDSPTVAKKRRVPDNFHGGDDAGLLPKMIKHE